jgi:hypothetical protein
VLHNELQGVWLLHVGGLLVEKQAAFKGGFSRTVIRAGFFLSYILGKQDRSESNEERYQCYKGPYHCAVSFHNRILKDDWNGLNYFSLLL